jgi:hypothetical protein
MKTILLISAFALTFVLAGNAAPKSLSLRNQTENTVTVVSKTENASKAKSGITKKHHPKKKASKSGTKKSK